MAHDIDVQWMEKIKQTLLTGWHFTRWLYLAFGAFFVIQAILLQDVLMGAVGSFFLFTAVTNTGCCGAGGCAMPVQKYVNGKDQEIDFEEVKTK